MKFRVLGLLQMSGFAANLPSGTSRLSLTRTQRRAAQRSLVPRAVLVTEPKPKQTCGPGEGPIIIDGQVLVALRFVYMYSSVSMFHQSELPAFLFASLVSSPHVAHPSLLKRCLKRCLCQPFSAETAYLRLQVLHSLTKERLELVQSLDGYMEKSVLPILKDVKDCWQPTDFLPDSSSPTFLDEVTIMLTINKLL